MFPSSFDTPLLTDIERILHLSLKDVFENVLKAQRPFEADLLSQYLTTERDILAPVVVLISGACVGGLRRTFGVAAAVKLLQQALWSSNVEFVRAHTEVNASNYLLGKACVLFAEHDAAIVDTLGDYGFSTASARWLW